MNLVSDVADWTYTHDLQWSAVTRERAIYGIADTIGCIIAASNHEVVAKTAAAFLTSASGRAMNVFDYRLTSAQSAAAVNGTAAHVLEIDDNFYPALTHASAQAVPALLALAQSHRCEGADILNAYILSVQIQAALAAPMGRNHTLTGWHSTGTIAMVASAAAGAKMIGMDEAGIANALSIACSMASSTKAQFGTETKAVHCGLSARNSVAAVELALAGLEGSADALDGPYGLLRLFNGTTEPEIGKVMPYLHGDNALSKSGLAPKRHACCGSAHKTMDALEDLKKEHGFVLEDVERIDAEIGTTNRQNLRYDAPQNGLEARFSLPYALILMMEKGSFWLSDLEDSAVLRPEVQRHLSKIKTHVLDLDEKSVPIDQPVAHTVNVRLKDGRELTKSRPYAKGTLADPFTQKDYKIKFRRCCDTHMTPSDAEALWHRLLTLDEQTEVASLLH